MTAEMLTRIFEPFYTTKEVGKGTGLGLALVYGFIQQSGGDLRASSTPGSGSTFEIFLPQVNPPVSPGLAAPAVVAGDQTGGETILVVEDQGPVRDLVTQVLSGLGYTVLAAQNGPQALQLLAVNPAGVGLILTDVVMPEMGGPELALKIRTLYPTLPVLLMSGYPDRVAAASFAGFELLAKPFTPTQLATRVRALLDKASPPGGPAPVQRQMQ